MTCTIRALKNKLVTFTGKIEVSLFLTRRNPVVPLQIVEINGVNTKNMTHSEAIDLIKSGGSVVRLLVRRGKMPPAALMGEFFTVLLLMERQDAKVVRGLDNLQSKSACLRCRPLPSSRRGAAASTTSRAASCPRWAAAARPASGP